MRGKESGRAANDTSKDPGGIWVECCVRTMAGEEEMPGQDTDRALWAMGRGVNRDGMQCRLDKRSWLAGGIDQVGGRRPVRRLFQLERQGYQRPELRKQWWWRETLQTDPTKEEYTTDR